jgi:hypothetical protein
VAEQYGGKKEDTDGRIGIITLVSESKMKPGIITGLLYLA